MHGRRWHLLKGNKTGARPTNIVFVDTESRQAHLPDGSTEHRLRLGVACYWRRTSDGHTESTTWYEFTTPSQFADWLVSKARAKTRLYVVSHNLSFDLPMLDFHRQLRSRGFEMTHFYFAGKVGFARYRGDGRTIQAVDNMNLFSTSLAKLGASLGIEKGRVDFATVEDAELLAYCRRDVEVMLVAWRTWLAFLDRYDLGVFAATLAGQAFNSYRHRFMAHPIYIHADERSTAIERAAYTGGRVEVFRQGHYEGQQFTQLDVNAMYPAVMAVGEYPTRLIGVRQSTSVANLSYLVSKYCLVARVRVNVDEPAFPCYVRGFRAYPVGRFTTSLVTDELRLALKRGWLEDVYEFAYYRRAPLFAEWVSWIWETEQEAVRRGDMVLRGQCKLLRNSLYGKWGQRGLERLRLRQSETLTPELEESYLSSTREWVREYNFAGSRWSDRNGSASFNAFVAIAAHVTAQARLRLWELINIAGRDHVYYCDTDSLIVDREGRANLASEMDPDRLGALKVEKEADALTLWCAKDYMVGEDRRQKGIRQDAVEVGSGVYVQDQWPGLMQTWRTARPDVVRVHPTTKRLERRISSGVRTSERKIEPWWVDDQGSGMILLNDPAVLAL